MDVQVFTLLFFFISVFRDAHFLLYTSIVQQKFGPLYDGIKLLVADEHLNAEIVRNETVNRWSETKHFLGDFEFYLNEFNYTDRLKPIGQLEHEPNFHQCYKRFERDIAHFDRELIRTFNSCKQSLQVTISYLENELFEEMHFISNAALQIQRVPRICGVSGLKNNNNNHVGIVVCVLARVGEIKQRLLQSSQFLLDVISEMFVGTKIDIDSCHDFREVKQELDETVASVTDCVHQNN